MSKRKRNELTWKEKCDIIKAVESGTKYSVIVGKYGIGKSTVSDIITGKDSIKIAANMSLSSVDRKRLVPSKFPLVEECMNTWIASAAGIIGLSDCHLLVQAQEFAVKLGLQKDDIKEGWISRWKGRHGLKSQNIHGESGSVKMEVADEWINQRVHEIMGKYQARDIYNCDETALFWKLLASKTITFKGQKCEGGKLSKERITLLVTANMAGEKEPLFVIGKNLNPRCFKNATPPVRYEANVKAWMTAVIFTKFVQKFDMKMRNENRHVALILDNCPAHPCVKNLTNVELFFLPANTRSKTQPMGAGVIRCFKANYRRRLALRQLIAFNDNQDFKLNLLDALYLATAAWSDISSSTIQNCFKHTGFSYTRLMEAVEEDKVEPLAVPSFDNIWDLVREAGLITDGITSADYILSDEDVRCTTALQTVDEIVREITGEVDDVIDINDPDDDEDEGIPPLKPSDAMKAVEQLCRTIEGLSVDDVKKNDYIAALMSLHDDLGHSIIQSKRQSLITDDFK